MPRNEFTFKKKFVYSTKNIGIATIEIFQNSAESKNSLNFLTKFFLEDIIVSLKLKKNSSMICDFNSLKLQILANKCKK